MSKTTVWLACYKGEMDLLDYQALQKRFQSMLSVATESATVMASDGVTGEMVSLSTQ